MGVFAFAKNLTVGFVLSLKTDIKARTCTGKHVRSVPSLPAVGAGQRFSPLGSGGGGWNAPAECQTLFPDEIIRDSSKAARCRSASQIQKT